MLKRICPFCGRLYEVGTSCNCTQKKRRLREQRKQYDKESRNKDATTFYHSTGWGKLSGVVQRQSGCTDALQSFLALLVRRGDTDVYLADKTSRTKQIARELTGMLVSPTGIPNRLPEGRIKLVVHHIVPRGDDKSRELDPLNVISLHPIVHNLVHDYYDASAADKEAMQQILFDAIKE